MARPRKNGLDYFPFDCDFFSDEKMVSIAGEFGIKGEIVAVKLLCAIYRNGYYALWNEPQKFKLAYYCPSVSPELIEQIVNRLVRWGLFDKALFDSAKVLTSEEIQANYFNAVRKRLPAADLPYIINNKAKGTVRLPDRGSTEVSSPDTQPPDIKLIVSSSQNGVSAAETMVPSAETQTISSYSSNNRGERVSSPEISENNTAVLQSGTVMSPSEQSGAKTAVSAEKTRINSGRNPQKKEYKIKENKRKDSQERVLKKSSAADRSDAAPSLKDVGEFFIKQGFRSSASLFYNYYRSRGWRTGNAPVEDWKALACAWDEREKKPKPGLASPIPPSSLADQLRKQDERKLREAAEKARQEAIENPEGLSPAEALARFKRERGLSPSSSVAEVLSNHQTEKI